MGGRQEYRGHEGEGAPRASDTSRYSLETYLEALTTSVIQSEVGVVLPPPVTDHLVQIQKRGTIFRDLLPKVPGVIEPVTSVTEAIDIALNEELFRGGASIAQFRASLGDALLYVQGYSPDHPERLFPNSGPHEVDLYDLNLIGAASYASAVEAVEEFQLDDVESEKVDLWRELSEGFDLCREIIGLVSANFRKA